MTDRMLAIVYGYQLEDSPNHRQVVMWASLKVVAGLQNGAFQE